MTWAQVLDTKSEALKDALYEEAVILQRRETDYRVELSGPAEQVRLLQHMHQLGKCGMHTQHLGEERELSRSLWFFCRCLCVCFLGGERGG